MPGSGDRALRVLLITEGTYPFYFGGVSTWCHLLVRGLPDVEFTLMSIVSDPRKVPLYELPPNVKAFYPVPIWGVREALETSSDISLSEVRRRKRATSAHMIATEFIPLFTDFLQQLLSRDEAPTSLDTLVRNTSTDDPLHQADVRFGQVVHQLHRFFVTHDFDTALRSQAAWDCFTWVAQIWYPSAAARHGYPGVGYSLLDLSRGITWLYHMLFSIAKPLPTTDVAHAAMAGACTLIAVCAKLEHGAAFMLTEHGIYLREAYLYEASASSSLFLKLLRLSFARRVSSLSYTFADQISPCCDYNQRWETRFGAGREKLRTIVYGVDSAGFTPGGKVPGEPRAIVAWVGRINPLKDLTTLLQAAALVRQSRPDVEFRLYGSATAEDQGYYEEILRLHAELGLESTVTFCGYVAKPELAYNEADVVVLSSISEALPFSIVEAMLCAKPVVATAVGGVPEQVAGAGTVVEPRNPGQMADAILKLLNDPARCVEIGKAAREKAVKEFSLGENNTKHRASYRALATRLRAGLQKVMGHRPLSRARSVGRTRSERTPGPTAASGKARRKGPILDEAAVADLVVQVSLRTRQPVDALEVTAIIESLGVTDDVAEIRYGIGDTFALGEIVLGRIVTRREPAAPLVVRDNEKPAPRVPEPTRTGSAKTDDWRAVRMLG